MLSRQTKAKFRAWHQLKRFLIFFNQINEIMPIYVTNSRSIQFLFTFRFYLIKDRVELMVFGDEVFNHLFKFQIFTKLHSFWIFHENEFYKFEFFAVLFVWASLIFILDNTQVFTYFFKGSNSPVQMCLFMCCRKLNSNPRLPFRHHWVKETNNVYPFL